MPKTLQNNVLTLADDNPFHAPDPYRLAPRRRRFVLQIFLLVAIGFAVFWPALAAGPIWQDVGKITTNTALRTWAGVGRLWVHPNAQAVYAPLTSTLLGAEHRLWVAELMRYRVVSLLLHVTSVLLIWKILRRLEAPGAWLAAALFAVHPVDVQAVVWVSRQGLILSTTLSAGALLAYLRWRDVAPPPPEDQLWEPPRWRGWLYLLAIVLFVAAVLAHPVAGVMPVVLLLVLWWRDRLPRNELLWLSPVLLIAIATFMLALMTPHAELPLSPLGISLMWGRAVVFSALKIICPYPLHFVYARWEIRATDPLAYLWLAGAVASPICAWLLRPRIGRGVFVGVVSYELALSAGLWLGAREWSTYSYIADFFQYPASIALIALLAAGVVGLGRRVSSPEGARLARLALGGSLMIAAGVLTWRQASSYASELTLWQSELAKGGAPPIIHDRLGKLLLDQQNVEEAAAQFNAALARDPADVEANIGLGRCFEAESRLDDAVQQYRKAIALSPNQASLYTTLAGVLVRQHHPDEAIDAYQRAIATEPADESAHNNLGLLLADSGKLAAAVTQYKAALQSNPDSTAVRLNLASAYFREGDYDRAAEQLQEVVRIDPVNFEAFMNSGAMLGQLREFPKAEEMFRAAVRLRPESPEAYNNLGLALAAQGKFNDATYNFAKAVQLKPDYAEAKENLAKAKQRLPRTTTEAL